MDRVEPATVPVASEPSTRPRQTLRTIQARVGGEISGNPDVVITGVNAIEAAKPGELTFAEHEKYAPQLRQSQAAACIVPNSFPVIEGRTLLRADHPRLAFVKAVYLFHPMLPPPGGVHREAVVAPDAELGEDVTIRECAVVRSKARIGRGTMIESGAHIGDGVTIGEHCFIGPNVVVMRDCHIGSRVIIHGGTVIGADGFGYLWAEGRYVKIPQLGNVIIEDEVELGANVCVDRATFGSTVIRRGTKVDNLVQIAHNDVIGEHVIMSGQVGLAGSVTVGNRVILGGKVGIADHLVIGDDARVGAGSGVTKSVPPGETFWWFPARSIQKVKRELAALALLPGLLKKLSPTPRRLAPRRSKVRRRS